MVLCSDTNSNYEKWLDEAVAEYELALDSYKKILGDDHFTMIGIYNNLPNALAKQGNFDKAIEMLDKSIVIQAKIFGQDHLYLFPVYEAKTKLCQMRHSPNHQIMDRLSEDVQRIRLAQEPLGGKHSAYHYNY